MLILLVLLGWAVYEQWFYEPPVADLEPLEQELQQWLLSRQAPAEVEAAPPKELFLFDPNSIGRDEWIQLGLTERQADGLLRYTAAGATFRIKRDLARVYTITPELYARLEPYILLPDSLPARDRRSAPTVREDGQWKEYAKDTFHRREPAAWRERERPAVVPLNINRADTMELVTLPGIGPAFARGIHKYREKLGGFVSLDQLHEVYVLRDKPDAVERLKQVLFVEPMDIRRIDINAATPEDLAAHPYISWKVAHGLVNYRRQHGQFPNVEAIKGSVLVNDSLYQLLHPYLTTGDP